MLLYLKNCDPTLKKFKTYNIITVEQRNGYLEIVLKDFIT